MLFGNTYHTLSSESYWSPFIKLRMKGKQPCQVFQRNALPNFQLRSFSFIVFSNLKSVKQVANKVFFKPSVGSLAPYFSLWTIICCCCFGASEANDAESMPIECAIYLLSYFLYSICQFPRVFDFAKGFVIFLFLLVLLYMFWSHLLNTYEYIFM